MKHIFDCPVLKCLAGAIAPQVRVLQLLTGQRHSLALAIAAGLLQGLVASLCGQSPATK